MAILKVSLLGNPVLRRVAEPIPPERVRSAEIQRLIDDMFDTMVEYGGVGLAAPQVHQSIRLLVTEDIPDPDGDDDDEDEKFLARRSVVINPEITFLTDEQVAYFEGCLSIPDVRGRVPRIKRIRIKGLDRDGNKIDREVEGFPAVVYQHEVDHVNGILFPDRMPNLSTLTYQREYEKFWLTPTGVED